MFRYVRAYTTVSGTVATGINFTAWIRQLTATGRGDPPLSERRPEMSKIYLRNKETGKLEAMEPVDARGKPRPPGAMSFPSLKTSPSSARPRSRGGSPMPTVTKGTNSYVSEAEATAYFGERLHSETWTGAVEADRQKALLTACRMLDGRIALEARQGRGRAKPGMAPAWASRILKPDTVPQGRAGRPMRACLAPARFGPRRLCQKPGASAVSRWTPWKWTLTGRDRSKPIPDTVFALVSHLGKRRGNLGSVSVNR